MVGGELGVDAWISDHLGSLSHSSYFSAKNKRRVAVLIGSIIPPIHCVAGGELGADAWISDHLGSLSHSSYFSAKNKRRVGALIGSIVPTIHCVAGGELGLTRENYEPRRAQRGLTELIMHYEL